MLLSLHAIHFPTRWRLANRVTRQMKQVTQDTQTVQASQALRNSLHIFPSELLFFFLNFNFLKLVIRDSQVLAKLGVVTIFFTGWGQTARLQRVRQNTAYRIQTETEQQQTARLQRVRQNTADRILKFDKRYKAFEIAGYFQKHREIIG